MLKKILFATVFVLSALSFVEAQTTRSGNTIVVLPFENKSGKSEFNWVGETFADSLADLFADKGLNVVTNQERKIIQQDMRIPLTSLPSLATSLKLAVRARATLLVVGDYNIFPQQGDIAASISVNAKVYRVEGGILSEDFPEGRRIGFTFNEALSNLQKIQGQLAWEILYRIDKVLNKLDKNAFPFSESSLVEAANKVPARAFEAYIKGLLTHESDPQTREIFFKNAMRIYADEKSGGTYSDAALELGHLYLNQRRYPEAIDYFSRIPAESAQYPEAAFYTGLIHWQQQNYEQALAVLRPLAEDLKLESVYNTIGAIAVQAARAEKKNKGKSAALLNEGIELLKRAAESAPNDASFRFNYGLALFLNENYDEAVEQLKSVLVASPQDGETYFLLAKAAEKTGNAEASTFDNQARIHLKDGNRYARYETDWKTGKSDGIGLRVVQPPRNQFVSVVMLKNQMRPVQRPVGKTEESLAQARQFYKDGRDDEAMEVLRRVLVSEPMSAEAFYLRGMIFLRRGNLDEAAAQLRTALFWDNRLTGGYVALVKIYLQKGDCLQAQNYYRSAAELDEENQEVQGLLRLVERCSK